MKRVISDIDCIYAKHCFDGAKWLTNTLVTSAQGRIGDITPDIDRPPKDAYHIGDDQILSAGLIDIQVNGGGGIMWGDNPDMRNLVRQIEAHQSLGTAWIMPTLISPSREKIKQAFGVVSKAIDAGHNILGLHIEGPYLNAAKSGIHPKDNIRTLDDDDLDLLCTLQHQGKTIVTIAPECLAAHQIEYLASRSVIIMAGHSLIDADAAHVAFQNGVRGVTHLFNAMSGLNARAPGLIGATLASKTTYASLICDGHHCHDDAVRIAWNLLQDRLMLISDAMATTGGPQKSFLINGDKITLQNGRLQNQSGTLAGAHLELAGAIENFANITDCGYGQAINLATKHVAIFLNLPNLGTIEHGKSACFSVLPKLDIKP